VNASPCSTLLRGLGVSFLLSIFLELLCLVRLFAVSSPITRFKVCIILRNTRPARVIFAVRAERSRHTVINRKVYLLPTHKTRMRAHVR